jgi:hypothetical protein
LNAKGGKAMKKLLVGALILPVALLGAARPAKAGSQAGAILAGVAVGVGAVLILDALLPRPVVAAPVVVAAPPPPPPVVYAPPPVVYAPPPVVYVPAPVYAPPRVVYAPPPVVYRPVPVVVHGPRHRAHPPHRGYQHGDRGRWPGKGTYTYSDH